MCWDSLKRNVTPTPRLVLALYVSIKKQPSPVVNPANQLESFIPVWFTDGLGTGTISGKESLTFQVTRYLEMLLNLEFLVTPSSVRCSLNTISSTIDLNNS